MTQRVLSKVLPVLFVLLPCTASSVNAADDLHVRVLGQWVSTSADLFSPSNLDEGFGAYVGLEKRLDHRWGIELGIGHTELEHRDVITIDSFFFSVTTEFETRLSWVPVTVAANYHLSPGRRADLYVAPRIGWAFADDLEVRAEVLDIGDGLLSPFPIIAPPGPPVPPARTTQSVDDSFIYGARLGLDWPIGSEGWGLSAAIDYTAMTLDIEPFEVDLDPLAVGVGIARRW